MILKMASKYVLLSPFSRCKSLFIWEKSPRTKTVGSDREPTMNVGACKEVGMCTKL